MTTTSDTNLDVLNEARDSLPERAQDAFTNFFVGWLSSAIAPDTWADAVRSAATYAEGKVTA